MCYSTNSQVRVKTEVTSSTPYGQNGYRTDCRNLKFNQVIYRREDTKVDAYFKASEPGAEFTMAGTDYATTGAAFGTWKGSGAAGTVYSYQMGICDYSDLSPGLWFSGNTIACWKSCNGWCNDVSNYFRSPAGGFTGSAFAENGHQAVGVKLLSVGMRFIPTTNTLGTCEACLTLYNVIVIQD